MYRLRVYYEDTDAGGVVYYANYFRFLERARTESLRDAGVDLADYVKQGIHFVVAHLEASYRRPAFYGDELTVETRLVSVRRSAIKLEQSIHRGDTLLMSCLTDMVSIRVAHDGPKAIAIPVPIRDALQASGR